MKILIMLLERVCPATLGEQQQEIADHTLYKLFGTVQHQTNESGGGHYRAIMSQTVLLCTISNDCMAPYWGSRGAYVMSYQANAILKT